MENSIRERIIRVVNPHLQSVPRRSVRQVVQRSVSDAKEPPAAAASETPASAASIDHDHESTTESDAANPADDQPRLARISRGKGKHTGQKRRRTSQRHSSSKVSKRRKTKPGRGKR